MVSHAAEISLDPRVQIVMDMDGWGPPWMKFESYRDYIDLEPVEFTAQKSEDVWFCSCKRTGKAPICDGSHKRYAMG